MPAAGPAQPSQKLQQILKDFQQIATMSGFLHHSYDLPQLRLFFTLYARLSVKDEAEGHAAVPKLQAWCDRIGVQLREESSSAILPPQIAIPPPQANPSGEGWYLVGTVTFNSKVTENSYLRVRTAVLAAYQTAASLREKSAHRVTGTG